MRLRNWLVGVLLAVTGALWQPAPVRASMWPFSLFSKKTTVKKPKSKAKPGKHYNTRTKAVKPSF